MNLCVIDPDYPHQNNKRNWSSILGTSVSPRTTLSGCDNDASLIVVVHAQFPVAELSQFAAEHDKCVVVAISGGIKDSAWKDGKRQYWRKQPVGKPMDEEFARNAKEFLADLKHSGCPHFDLLEPFSNESLCALRLLCEAWVMNDGKKDKPHGGIVIHAPVTADDWFDPFVEGFRNLDAENKKQSAKTSRGKIADLMGNARGDVKLFYDKLAKLYEGNVANLIPGEFKDDIERLVKTLNTASTT